VPRRDGDRGPARHTELHQSRWRGDLTALLARLIGITSTVLERSTAATTTAAEAHALAERAAATADAAAARAIAYRRGRGTLTAVALNASVDVVITWRAPMPVAVYDVEDELPDLVLGKLTRTGLKTTRERATITYKASAATLAGVVTATAITLA